VCTAWSKRTKGGRRRRTRRFDKSRMARIIVAKYCHVARIIRRAVTTCRRVARVRYYCRYYDARRGQRPYRRLYNSRRTGSASYYAYASDERRQILTKPTSAACCPAERFAGPAPRTFPPSSFDDPVAPERPSRRFVDSQRPHFATPARRYTVTRGKCPRARCSTGDRVTPKNASSSLSRARAHDGCR